MIDTSVLGLIFMVGLIFVVAIATRPANYEPKKQPYRVKKVFDYVLKA